MTFTTEKRTDLLPFICPFSFSPRHVDGLAPVEGTREPLLTLSSVVIAECMFIYFLKSLKKL